ncbi:MAG: amidohydrolase family protein [Thermoanaerobaculia bacterium]
MISTRKSTVVNLALLLLAALPLFAHGVTRYDNGRWFDGETFVQRTMWSVEGVFREKWDAEAEAIVDLRSAYVIPPLADAHHHAFSDGRDPAGAIQTFLSQGIFYVKNPNNLPSLTASIRPKVNQAESVDVVYSNGGLTSSGGHPAPLYARIAPQLQRDEASLNGDAYHVVDRAEDLEKVWPALRASKPDFVKVYLERSEFHGERRGRRGLDPALLPLIVKRAQGDSLRVSAHIATRADFLAAVHAGVDEINHLPLERLEKADAALAARKGTWVVTTTISHRPTDGIQDLDAIHLHNIRLLREAGVKIAIGTDDGRTAVAEAENLLRIGAFDRASLLRTWTIATPATIFPRRKLGQLADGYEASFLALPANPLEDFAAIRNITLRVKQGHALHVTSPKPLATEALVPIVMSKGIEAALAEYDRLRADPQSAYDTGEQALNALGYAMLNHGQIDGAIAIFRANVERFSHSSNVYDSLGEAYMKKGEKELAIANYEKSLERNPANRNAEEMLRKLRGGSDPSLPPPHS